MRDLQEIISQKPVFLGVFKKKRDVLNAFDINDCQDVHILFAAYFIDGYDGSAYVLYEKDGKLYDVTGSHCSCYGLENQFDPEECELRVLRDRLKSGFGSSDFCKELKEFIGIYK
jgi:hypothetical protein